MGQNTAHLDQNTGASWGQSGLLDITVPRASLGLLYLSSLCTFYDMDCLVYLGTYDTCI